jgi:hypothetical protein
MRGVALWSRWFIPLLLITLCFATSAYADTDVSLTDPTTWWAWLLSRVSVPGG